jgi:hypothetical protein
MKVSFHIHQRQNFNSQKSNNTHKNKIVNSMWISVNRIMLKSMKNTKKPYKRQSRLWCLNKWINKSSTNALPMRSQLMR